MQQDACNVKDWFASPKDIQDTIHRPKQGNPTLARGGFGEVSVAIHTSPERWSFLAIKSIVLAPPVGGGGFGMPSTNEPKLSKEVFNEICALRLLNPHPNVVELLAVYPGGESTVSLTFGYCPTDLYLTLEWRRRQLLPPLPAPVIQGIALDLFTALHHCHSSAVVHLDIKPGNLLVSSSGVIRLCDFGLAQPYHDDDAKKEEAKGLCTLYYRPPEVLFGSQAMNPAMDMYSMGLVLCELVAGFPIFRGE